jgi:hypothetical protein
MKPAAGAGLVVCARLRVPPGLAEVKVFDRDVCLEKGPAPD